MSLRTSRRSLRHLAAQVLLLWLFALASGIVNACVVGLDGGLASHQAGHGHGAMAGHDHDAAAAAPVDGVDALAPCVKFCDDESSSIPAVQAQIVPAPGAWITPPATDALAPVVADARSAARVPHADPAPDRVPIPIAFLRLTR